VFEHIVFADRAFAIHDHGIADLIEYSEHQDVGTEFVRQGNFVTSPVFLVLPATLGVFDGVADFFAWPKS